MEAGRREEKKRKEESRRGRQTISRERRARLMSTHRKTDAHSCMQKEEKRPKEANDPANQACSSLYPDRNKGDPSNTS